MLISLADWKFFVDENATRDYTVQCSEDHCTCPYCQNFYENVDRAHPKLRPVLDHFGIFINGPSELMPLEPNVIMACYRVIGKIIQAGESCLHVEGVPLSPEPADRDTFYIWIGELTLPWTQATAMSEVISPANEPDFMQRMYDRWLKTREHSQCTDS